jgi:putative transposase
VRRRFGYRRIHGMLRPQFPVNCKKVYQLYSADGGAKAQKRLSGHQRLLLALQPAEQVSALCGWRAHFGSVLRRPH